MASTAPFILVDGKKIAMPKPKIKLWRCLVQFQEKQQNGELDNAAALDEIIKLIVIAFNNAEVTAGVIEENLDVGDLHELFAYIGETITKSVSVKAAQLPNGKAPTGI